MNKRKWAGAEGEEKGVAKNPKTEGEGPSSGGSSPEAAPPTASASSSNNVSVPLRTSARVLRKKEEERKESESEDPAPPSPEKEEEKEEKPRRTWEQWSEEDKGIFFEALNEGGKNFDSIQGYFQAKANKKKSGLVFKNKEQVRTFYYRTWHKISKHIDFPDGLKKSSQELYGLINYGELRKKIGVLDEKNGAKLSELVFNGHTTVRVKGKTVRVRTPLCRALKRLNQKLDSKVNPNKALLPPLPNVVVVDLKPSTEEDLNRVHAHCYHNPHVRLYAPLTSKLGAVLDQLERKWISSESRLREKLLKKTAAGQNNAESTRKPDSELWLMTVPGTRITRPVITSAEPVTSATLSLSSLQAKMNGIKEKSETEKPNGDVEKASDKSENKEENGAEEKQSIAKEEKEEVPKDFKNCFKSSSASASTVKKEEEPKKVEKDELGWNKATAESLTVGELFLMIGCASSENREIELCYSWKPLATAEPSTKRRRKAIGFISKLASSEVSRKQQQKASLSQSPSVSKNGRSAAVQNGFASPKTAQNKKEPPSSPLAVPLVSSPTNGGQQQATNGNVEFRRPADPPHRILINGNSSQILASTQSSKTAQAFRQQLSQLRPRYNNRKGRPMSRKTVISRQLLSARPLQPKKSYVEAHSVKLRLLKQNGVVNGNLPTVGSFPIVPPLQSQVLVNQPQVTIMLPPQLAAAAAAAGSNANGEGSNNFPTISIPDSSGSSGSNGNHQQPEQISSSNRAASPSGSISSLFNDTSLSDLASNPARAADQFLDSVLENSNSSVLQTPPRHQTPPSSPSRGVVNESWLPELSLSSFLNLGDSPAKAPAQAKESQQALPHLVNEDSSHSTSSEVDRQLFSMMTENSVDFTAKFARLASHVDDSG